MNMLQNERYLFILNQLEKKGKILVADVAKQLSVTPETIRRDLDTLEKEKKLRRVHGGAIKFQQIRSEPHFNKKMNVNYHEKEAIAKKAVEYIQDDDTIMIDVGTTTVHMAKYIRGLQRLTIVTNSLMVADLLNSQLEHKMFDGKVIVLGGVTNPEQKSVAGTLTIHMLKNFQFDKVFLSCGGVTEDEVSDFDLEESIISKQVVEQANQVFLLADSSKLTMTSFYKICPLSSIDYMICNEEMPQKWKYSDGYKKVEWIVANGGKE